MMSEIFNPLKYPESSALKLFSIRKSRSPVRVIFTILLSG